jgi:hypothetical protein
LSSSHAALRRKTRILPVHAATIRPQPAPISSGQEKPRFASQIKVQPDLRSIHEIIISTHSKETIEIRLTNKKSGPKAAGNTDEKDNPSVGGARRILCLRPALNEIKTWNSTFPEIA